MKNSVSRFWAVAILIAFPAAIRADVVLSISANADPSHLLVGDVVTFNVVLSGVDSSDPKTALSYLAAAIGYDNTLFSSNPTVTAGGVVPDLTGFVGTGLPAAAHGSYDGFLLASVPIAQSGKFFSFNLSAKQVGSGTLSFTDAAATFASDPDQTIRFVPASFGLSFHIDGPTAVPEPSSIVFVLAGGIAGFGYRRMTRSNRRRCTGLPAPVD